MDADILTMSSKGQISIPAKIRKEMSVSIGDKFVIYLCKNCEKRSCSNPVSMGVKYFCHPHHIYMAIQ